MYNIFDHTKRNFESIFDKLYPKEEKKHESILENECVQFENKYVALRIKLNETNPKSPEFDALLEELILFHTASSDTDVTEEKIKNLKEKVKMEVGKYARIEESKKINVADNFIHYKRTIYDEIDARKNKPIINDIEIQNYLF